jgi:WD40 repeat protein
VAATRRGSVQIYDAASGALVRACDPPVDSPWTVVFSPDGSKILSGNWSRVIDVWNVATGRLEWSLSGHRGLVTDLAFHPRQPGVLASSGADGQVLLWDFADPRATPILTLHGFDDGWEVWALDFDSAGNRLMATSGVGTTLIWDLHHFDRHIAGNMRTWVQQHKDLLPAEFDAKAMGGEVLKP